MTRAVGHHRGRVCVEGVSPFICGAEINSQDWSTKLAQNAKQKAQACLTEPKIPTLHYKYLESSGLNPNYRGITHGLGSTIFDSQAIV